ncbi:MAG: FmdB family zinc ribbon protein [Gaiellaceae bacterium]
MPIYEYRCPNGHTFEVFQKMTDPPVDACMSCGAGPVEKILFPVAVHFKGSGFYSTDYGKKGRTGARESDGGPPSEKKADKPTEKTAEKPSGGEKKAASD